jgi:hypothetical protein
MKSWAGFENKQCRQPCHQRIMGCYLELQFRQNAIFVAVDRREILPRKISLFVIEEAYSFLHSFFFCLHLSLAACSVEAHEARCSLLQVIELHFVKYICALDAERQQTLS